jgi:Ca-activated chloride channel homolog
VIAHHLRPDRILGEFFTRRFGLFSRIALLSVVIAIYQMSLGVVLYAQTAPCPPNQSAPSEILKQPNYRQIVVFSQGRDGQPVPELTAKDLRLFQGNKKLKITYFQAQPVAVGILVDTSGSMERKLPMCRTALETFINRLNPSDEISLIAFSDRPFLLARPTTLHSRVVSQLAVLHAYGRTALYNALIANMQLLSQSCSSKRAVLLITDGLDEGSVATLDQTTNMARKMSVPIYSIGIGNPKTQTTNWLGSMSGDMEALDTKALAALAKDTGGETFVITLDDNGAALKQTATALADRIGNRYVVGFISNGSADQLRLEAPNQRELTFRIESPG